MTAISLLSCVPAVLCRGRPAGGSANLAWLRKPYASIRGTLEQSCKASSKFSLRLKWTSGLGRAVSTLPEKILPYQLSRGSGPRAVCCETGQGTWPAQTTPQGAVIRLLGSNKCGFKFVQMWVQVCVYMRVRVCALIRLTVSLPSQCGSRLSLSKSPGSAQHKCLPSTT